MTRPVGISGFTLYVPPHRVSLEQWCSWTDSSWEKIQAVVGRSFRVKGPSQSLYTMAASAVMRLIEQYDIDPSEVGMLILGTESSSDNSAGAVILRGMVDQALVSKGMPRLARDLEVPEIKHACLGGIYGLKQALRYLQVDGAGRKAIVVAADIAEYERGSTGEPTQGAGAVAMLVEENPRILRVDLRESGSASSYRGPDFRKPFGRFLSPEYAKRIARLHDFPVFNGKYSTACYLDEVLAAIDAMVAKRPPAKSESMHDDMARVFFHRPYRRITETAWALSYFASRAQTSEGGQVIRALCAAADVDADSVLEELGATHDLFASVESGRLNDDPFRQTLRLLRFFRSTAEYEHLVGKKLELGSDPMMDLGNLYTASLPGWLAAAVDEAAAREDVAVGEEWLLVGYGSGDAAEAIPVRLVDGFQEAARRVGFRESLEGAIDLDQAQYEALHDGRDIDIDPGVRNGFVVDRVGQFGNEAFDEVGIEYYRFVP